MTEKITILLREAEQGNVDAKNQLFETVYKDLKTMAAHWLRDQKPEDTLQASALVSEVYLRLFPDGQKSHRNLELREWKGRRQFFGVAASAMRQILVDSAQRKKRAKRGPSFQRVLVDPNQICATQMASHLLALDEAMSILEKTEPLIAEVVKLRFFAGLTLREVADQLEIGRRTADGYWAYAKAWLMAEINDTHEVDKQAS